MSAIYKVSAANPQAVALFQQHFNLPQFVASIMVSRGITTLEQAESFLHPSLERDWLNPYTIPGMEEVVTALEEAIRSNKHIVIFGDFDVDGVSATAVMTRGTRALGGHVTPFIPRRFDEGYAITPAAYERVKKLKPDLIVTVDCGISCKEEIETILSDGIKVIVTDHHEPPEAYRTAAPLVDPKTDSSCASAILAGVGVALKVVQALGARFGFPQLWRSYIDLATLGTVADLMPMRDENRALVADGIRRIAAEPRPSLAALLACSGVQDKTITATELSFSVIPRLNAAGRMGDATIALDLLMSDDYETAYELACKLETVNDKRRAIEAELSELARAEAARVYKGQRILVVAGRDWHEGVKGIVASRLVHTYGVPCLLFTIEGDEARGSGRTVGQVNLFKAIESVSDILTRFGGHEAAVGVTLPVNKLQAFTERICAYMNQLPDEDFHPLVQIDACVGLDELTVPNIEKMALLAPFGQENKTPCLLAQDVAIVSSRAVGAEKNHFSCVLSDGTNKLDAIMFHCNDIEVLSNEKCLVSAAFEIQIDEWRGRRTPKALLKRLAPIEPCSALEACLDQENCEFMAQLCSSSVCSKEGASKSAQDDASTRENQEALRKENRTFWEHLAQADSEGLEHAIIKAIIGDSELHQKQREVLDSLDAGISTLCIMATGRGKSLIFQVHAAKIALIKQGTSLFVYPLRALINDQAYHLRSALSQFGISIDVLNGETAPELRADIYKRLAQGNCDILLTTPEFLNLHAELIGSACPIDFLVIDEAHHIGLATMANRPLYKSLGCLLDLLGNPTVLALTATAPDDTMGSIKEQLSIEQCVFDRTERPNLQLDDRRNLRGRDDYLARLIATGEKTVIYVNSRIGSIQLARILRHKVPQIALMIGFYNGGLSRRERKRIEEMFRAGQLSVLVATSAFGEGIDISDIRHVVLYHLPYNEIEFNQMSGRAGRDGGSAKVHLLFNDQDASINESILNSLTPDRDKMATIYRVLREMSQQAAPYSGWAHVDGLTVIKRAESRGCCIDKDSIRCALAVFQELGLFEVRPAVFEGKRSYEARLIATQRKVNLENSIRYQEGIDEYSIFESFRNWVFSNDASALRLRIIRPILPSDVRR